MNDNRSLKSLTLIAGLSGLIYLLIFTLPFPLTRLYATIPPVDYAKLTRHSPAGFIAYVGGVVLLFGLYGWAFRLTAPSPSGQRSAVSGRFVLLSSACLAALSIPTYPLTAIDLFIYAIRSRGWVLYGLNPLATAPDALPAHDPWLGLAAEWIDAPSPYGPVWEWLSLAAFHLSGGTFLAHLLALKLLAALAYLGCVWLIYRIMRQLRPEWAVASALAFAWSPLALLESVQNGHNDIIMVFFLLAAVWVLNLSPGKWDETAPKSSSPIRSPTVPIFARSPIRHSLFAPSLFARRSPLTQTALVSLFLALSILVKFVTILIVPFFWLALAAPQPTWRRRVGVTGFSALLMGLLVALPMLPLWPGWENWAILTAGSQAGRSLLALLILGLRDPLGLSRAFDLSRNSILVIFSLIYLYYLWTSFRQAKSSPAPLLACSPAFYVFFWYVLLVAPVFHAWYLLWFVPLAPLLLPNRQPLRASTVFSLTALLIIPYFETVRVWYPALLQNQFIGHLIGVPLLIGPPILALFWPVDHSANSKQ